MTRKSTPALSAAARLHTQEGNAAHQTATGRREGLLIAMQTIALCSRSPSCALQIFNSRRLLCSSLRSASGRQFEDTVGASPDALEKCAVFANCWPAFEPLVWLDRPKINRPQQCVSETQNSKGPMP